MSSLELMRGGVWHHGIVPEIGVPLAETEELCYELNALPPSRKTERETILAVVGMLRVASISNCKDL